MRILVAEDDPNLAEGLCRSLRQAGYAVDCVNNGDEADAALETNEFDLLILDIGLPKKSGLEVLKRLRSRNSAVAVLILTARDSVRDRVTGLDAGADDYLAKPFELAELSARVRALTRRGMAGGCALISHGALTYDQVGRVARLNGEPIEFSARELSLLEIQRRAGPDGNGGKDCGIEGHVDVERHVRLRHARQVHVDAEVAARIRQRVDRDDRARCSRLGRTRGRAVRWWRGLRAAIATACREQCHAERENCDEGGTSSNESVKHWLNCRTVRSSVTNWPSQSGRSRAAPPRNWVKRATSDHRPRS